MTDLVEIFRKALMVEHHDDWDMETVSEAAHICARAALAAHDTPPRESLVQALWNAAEGMDEMLPYVPEYFVEKWGLKDYVDRARATLDSLGDVSDSEPPSADETDVLILEAQRLRAEVEQWRAAAEAMTGLDPDPGLTIDEFRDRYLTESGGTP